MIEILVIFCLSVWIRTITEPKGYKWGKYVLLAVALWIFGEIIGVFVGSVAVFIYSLRSGYVYLFALAGALIGGIVSVIIAKGLRPKEIVNKSVQEIINTEKSKENVCPICGYVYMQSDRFCRKCGSKL